MFVPLFDRGSRGWFAKRLFALQVANGQPTLCASTFLNAAMVRALAVLVMTVAMASASAQSLRTESFDRFLRDNGVDPATFVMEPGPFGIARFQIHVHHHLSIPCEGPRGCYAKSDLLDVSVSCPVRAAMIHRRTSFDLNGNVVAVAESVPPPAVRFTIPRAESLEARVVTIFCGDSPYVR